MRRLLPFLVLLALLVAPYGRMQAQAAVPHAPQMMMIGHCQPSAPTAPTPAHHGSIDCMIACAAIVFAAEAALNPAEVAAILPESRATLHLKGLRPAADPPPPRLS